MPASYICVEAVEQVLLNPVFLVVDHKKLEKLFRFEVAELRVDQVRAS